MYDVPRSNPRKVVEIKSKEAIYVNESFSENIQNYQQESIPATDSTYDVPRTVVSFLKDSEQLQHACFFLLFFLF